MSKESWKRFFRESIWVFQIQLDLLLRKILNNIANLF